MRDGSWQTENILITVRAAPNPSRKYVETTCVAGVRLRDKAPIRIYPVPARQLSNENRFKKYDIVSANLIKSGDDIRHESHKVDFSTIRFVDHVGTSQGSPSSWARRDQMVEPFRCANSIEELRGLQNEGDISSAPSLALIRPRAITRFRIQPTKETDWPPSQLAKLQQLEMFDRSGKKLLEFIPFQFKYEFLCQDDACRGHNLSVIDWEITESFRKWRREYGEDGWRDAMYNKYWDQLALSRDLQFYVGTMQKHPKTWTIIGLYYPPQKTQLQMPGLDI